MRLNSELATFYVLLGTIYAEPHVDYHVDQRWLQKEVDLLASLQARLTGSPQHDALIDHISVSLEKLGLLVQTDAIEFSYSDPQIITPVLNIAGDEIAVSSWVPYSGTNSSSAYGKLVDLTTHSADATPDWAAAKDAIAVTNLTNPALNFNTFAQLFPGSPAWPDGQIGIAPATYGHSIPDLDTPTKAGVKAVVYILENISTELADGQYVPFVIRDQPIPALFIQSRAAIESVLHATKTGAPALVALPGRRIPRRQTRTVYTVISGTDPRLANETTIINTHTDGTNIIEENGHIALLAHARRLAAHSPRRTTVLVFVTGHLHYGNLIAPPGRAMTIWLDAHPDLWRGRSGERRAAFASCVEHLGAVHYVEDLVRNTYKSTSATEPELLYAATPQLAALVFDEWRGAEVNATRVVDASSATMAQSGEGLPLLMAGIPEVSLVTSPAYLLKVYPLWFDERVLLDARALARQVESFERIYARADTMDANEFGTVKTKG